MAKDAVATLEATREKLIKKLLEKRSSVEEQLRGLGYDLLLDPVPGLPEK
jgi:hypothetical protein